MSRIKNLYTYLITNRRAEVDGWLEDYLAFSRDVAEVSKALNGGEEIKAKVTYAQTSFAGENDPWQAFVRRLLFEKANGISSRGQSVLSGANFERFINETEFVAALAELIKEPSKDNFVKFDEAWERAREKHGANRNPLLVNRTLAACTMGVSSTVNGSDFESVFWWLVREEILPAPSNPEAGWYEKNVQLMDFLREEFATELGKGETSEQLLSIFVWNLFENISNPFTLKKQVVKYGAPGTGKTFTAKQNARLLFSIWQEKYAGFSPRQSYEQCSEVVQFHPSYGYEDFIEGLRPTLGTDGQPQLTLQNGVFKEFCRRAGAWEIEVYRIPKVGPELAARWPDLTVGELIPHVGGHLKSESWQSIVGLKTSERIAEVIPPFFFIIDEVNRAELSRVLGELMICIEYRGVEGAISTQYAVLNTAKTTMLATSGGSKFFIPHNVYIVGTMNTIDRSVESFDLALRRRFRWERVEPDVNALFYHLKQRDAKAGSGARPWAGLAKDLAALNERIRETDILGADYEIGHAYLMNLRYPQTLTRSEVRERVWEDSIKPLLEEYLRGSGRGETLIPEFGKAFGIV